MKKLALLGSILISLGLTVPAVTYAADKTADHKKAAVAKKERQKDPDYRYKDNGQKVMKNKTIKKKRY